MEGPAHADLQQGTSQAGSQLSHFTHFSASGGIELGSISDLRFRFPYFEGSETSDYRWIATQCPAMFVRRHPALKRRGCVPRNDYGRCVDNLEMDFIGGDEE